MLKILCSAYLISKFYLWIISVWSRKFRYSLRLSADEVTEFHNLACT